MQPSARPSLSPAGERALEDASAPPRTEPASPPREDHARTEHAFCHEPKAAACAALRGPCRTLFPVHPTILPTSSRKSITIPRIIIGRCLSAVTGVTDPPRPASEDRRPPP